MNVFSANLDLGFLVLGYIWLLVVLFGKSSHINLLSNQESVVVNALSSLFGRVLDILITFASIGRVSSTHELSRYLSVSSLASFIAAAPRDALLIHLCVHHFLSLLFVQKVSQICEVLLTEVVFVELALLQLKLLCHWHWLFRLFV